MGALGELNDVVDIFRERGKADDEQKRVLDQYDKYFESLSIQLDEFSRSIGEKKRPEKEDYRRLYDILQRNTDKKLESFDELYDAFEDSETETNLTREELYQWGRDLSDIAPRVPGTKSMDRTNQYIIDKLESFGIKAWTEPINFNGVFFHEWSFEINSPKNKKYICFPENNVGFGNVTADIVDIGRGCEEDYKGKEVSGRIVLLNLGEINEHEGPCAQRRRYTLLHLYDIAYANNVAGIIVYFTDTPGNTIKLLEPGIKPIGGSNIWGPAEVGSNHQFTIPVLNIGRPDAEEIKELLKSGSVEGHIVIDGVRKVSTTNIVLGLLPGNGDRAISVGSHSCTAFEGAVCDTIGVVGTLALAKHFSGVPLEKRNKSLLFFFDSFHVWGNCCQTAITVLDRYKTLTANTDSMIWLDHIGNGKADTIHNTTVSDNPVLWPLTAFSQYKYNIAPYVVPVVEIWSICATGAYQRIGIPTVTVQAMDEYTLTPEDTWDKFDPDVVYRDILAHVDLAEALQKLEVPLDHPVEPFGGCGSLFTDLSQPQYAPGESYVPEPDYPLYVGGKDGEIQIIPR